MAAEWFCFSHLKLVSAIKKAFSKKYENAYFTKNAISVIK